MELGQLKPLVDTSQQMPDRSCDLIKRGDALNAVFTSDFRHEAHEAIADLHAVSAPDVAGLVEAAEEVLRISDRDHKAWHRLRAEIAKIKETGK